MGNSVADFRDALFASCSGIGPVELQPGQTLSYKCVALVKNFAAEGVLDPSLLVLTDRSAQFALIAAKQAVDDSRIIAACEPGSIAVLMGCSAGGQLTEEAELVKLYTATGRVHPFTVPRVMANSGASNISILFGITGPVLTYSTACASSAHAIGQAFHMIRSGMVNAALAGGHEAPLAYGFLKSWEAMRVVSPTRCKPFSSERDGMTLGEGSAILALEEREQAIRRGATIYAEICGFGMSSDAFHITQPCAAGPAAAMRSALRDAQCDASAVSYINAHGTGTAANDRAEAEAIHAVFGELASEVPVSSTKALHGHTIGAAGAIEALVTILAIKARRLPVNLGGDSPDSTLRLNLVTEPLPYRGGVALSNSFAFGGLNASLLFRSHE
jgi:3-oxoacyl-[acyl-carrier-protein] synthase II/nodulation protein E